MGVSSGDRQTYTWAASAGDRSCWRTLASASATVASGRRMIGSVVMSPPAVRSSYDSRRRTSAASSGRIRASSRSLSASGSSESRSAASSGSIASRTSAARSSFSLPRISTWSSPGSSSRTSASRSSSRAAATSALRLGVRWCRALATSVGRSRSKVATRLSVPCPCSSSEKPLIADHSTVRVSPLRRRAPPRPLRTKTLSISQSRRAGSCWMATSRTVTSSSVSFRRTRLSRSSPRTSRSVGRCSNRRMLTTPVVMTWPDSTPVTRVIGRKMRRRLTTSTTMPSSRGGLPPTRSIATRSRTRPTWSPFGSNTGTPARCETKTLGVPAAILCASLGPHVLLRRDQASPCRSATPWRTARTALCRTVYAAQVRCRLPFPTHR